ncbi:MULTISPECIES: hypothetical protein [unclassified Streptomyces]|uniref:hypothetical protein n=1 Tax=unclassified Streptomyces TaxID=2593676 RepID=UPI003395693A
MKQVQQGVVSILASLGKFHEELTEFSREMLREYSFGGDVELVHQVLFESIEESVRFVSLHRFTISVGVDFSDCREIEVSASILIGESSCAAAVEIRADLDEPVGEPGERKAVLHEENFDGIELGGAIVFLGKAVRNLGNLVDPLKNLVERHV